MIMQLFPPVPPFHFFPPRSFPILQIQLPKGLRSVPLRRTIRPICDESGHFPCPTISTLEHERTPEENGPKRRGAPLLHSKFDFPPPLVVKSERQTNSLLSTGSPNKRSIRKSERENGPRFHGTTGSGRLAGIASVFLKIRECIKSRDLNRDAEDTV